MEKEFLIDDHKEEIAQLEKDLLELVDFDEWTAMECGGGTWVDYYQTAVNLIDAGYRKVENKTE